MTLTPSSAQFPGLVPKMRFFILFNQLNGFTSLQAPLLLVALALLAIRVGLLDIAENILCVRLGGPGDW